MVNDYSILIKESLLIRVMTGLLTIDPKRYDFLWVTDFPLFTFDHKLGQLQSTHHPFTAPMDDDINMLYTNPEQVL
jgi:aspartyl-tRNA synthetase